MDSQARIFIAGHRGMVGSAVHRKLRMRGHDNLILRTSAELDLRDPFVVQELFEKENPEYVFLCAARVGGILANNSFGGDFIYDNLMIQTNVIHAAHRYGVKKLLFLGSSCIYPAFARQPIDEDELLSGKLERTNEPYAIAKIAGIKMCQAFNRQYGCNFISVMPTNLYGPNDNYDLTNAHVLPALLRKFYEAQLFDQRTVTVWGSGTPKREFLHVDDLADACLFLMDSYNSPEIINVGTGKDLSIRELAFLLKDITGFEGQLVFDLTKPDGTPRKLLNINKIRSLGWAPAIDLTDGLTSVWQNYSREAKSADKIAMV